MAFAALRVPRACGFALCVLTAGLFAVRFDMLRLDMTQRYVVRLSAMQRVPVLADVASRRSPPS